MSLHYIWQVLAGWRVVLKLPRVYTTSGKWSSATFQLIFATVKHQKSDTTVHMIASSDSSTLNTSNNQLTHPSSSTSWLQIHGFTLCTLLPAIRSLERRARYLFYCMFFFVRSTISRQPAGRFTPKFACRRTLVPDVSSPHLGVGGPRRAEKGQMKFSLLWESMGNFCILAVFERYLSNACTDPHQILFV